MSPVVFLGCVLVLWLGVVGQARAAFGVANFDAQITNSEGGDFTQAGGHPFTLSNEINLNTHSQAFTFQGFGEFHTLEPDASAKDIVADLPPGVVGDPRATPVRCRLSQLSHSSGPGQHGPLCPSASQVGVVQVTFDGLGTPFYVSGVLPVYNMVPPPGVPARLGFNIEQNVGVVIMLDAAVRNASDYGASVVSRNISEGLPVLGTRLTFWGVPADSAHDSERSCPGETVPGEGGPGCATDAQRKPFLRLATSCPADPSGEGALWRVRADSWFEPGVFTEGSFLTHLSPGLTVAEFPGAPSSAWGHEQGTTGCDRVSFEPSISLQPSSSTPDSPSGLSMALSVPQSEDPNTLGQADLRKITVTLPEGVSINPAVANGLDACSPAQIGLGSEAPPACPDASRIGAVEVQTPLLEAPLEGSLYVASQGDNPFGSLLAVYLVAQGEGVDLKLPGELHADPLTGRLTATFENLPQQPFSRATLTLKSGPRAPLATPGACGSSAVGAVLEGWNGKSVSEPTPYNVGCTPGVGGFTPQFSAGTTNPQAAGFSPFVLSFSRQDGEQQLGGLTVKTPPGLLGILTSVTQCPEPQASQGACGAGSLIGHVAASAGVGSDPVWVQGGQAYLTGPYKGSPFGLSVAISAKAGPFDLGTVVVRSRIDVDPHTAQITIASDPFPTILQGIPLHLRTVNVTVDRPGFIFNPTDCEPFNVDGTISSTQGASASVSSHFQAVNCATLPFHPTFRISTQAGTSKAQGASLDVKVTSGQGQANIAKTIVTLPKQLPARLTTIQQACPEATFAANPATCPAASAIGIGTVSTPILANPATGPAYLVSHGGAAFPDVVVILQGEGVAVDLVGGVNIKHGITTASFNQVPDVPVTQFELRMPEGPHSGLAASLPVKARGSMCGQKLVMPTTITGQNGAQIKQSTKIAVTGCPKAKKKGRAKRKHRAKVKRAGRRK